MAAGPLLTVARCRYHQPMLVILLPFAAIGVWRLFQPVPRIRAICGTLVFGVFLLVSISAIPVMFRWSLWPSTYYHGLTAYLSAESTETTAFEDVVVIRSRNELPLTETVDYSLPAGKATVLQLVSHAAVLKIETFDPKTAAELILVDKRTGKSTTIRPVESANWQQFRETEIPGIDVMWTGGLVRARGI